jgi:hypothetical protein
MPDSSVGPALGAYNRRGCLPSMPPLRLGYAAPPSPPPMRLVALSNVSSIFTMLIGANGSKPPRTLIDGEVRNQQAGDRADGA